MIALGGRARRGRPGATEGHARSAGRRIDWQMAGPVTVGGIVAILLGLRIEQFDGEAFAELLIDVGAALGLILVLVLIEHGIVDHVAEVAADVADRQTADLRRMVRLTDLERDQALERDRRKRDGDQAVERVMAEELTARSICDLLLVAGQQKLVVDGRFHVRTSPDPDGHVLYLMPGIGADENPSVWLDFQPFDLDGGPDGGLDGGPGGGPPARSYTTVLWRHDRTAAQIAGDLESGLLDTNRPLLDFSLAHALRQLARSVAVMRAAREAEAGSPLRLAGSLEVLVNDAWAVTSFGLESVTDPVAYGLQPGPALVIDPPPPHSLAPGPWDEARTWATRRLGWSLAPPAG